MPVCQTLLILSLPLFSCSLPLFFPEITSEYDRPQAVLNVTSNGDDNTPAFLPASPNDISGSARAQDVFTPDSSATTIWFSPEDDPIPPQPSNSGGEDAPLPAPSTRPLVAAYYPDWTASQLPPEKVDFDRLDWVDFAFAVPDPTTYTPSLDADSGDLLNRLVAAAHAKSKHVKVSIGGWTGSAHFSDAVKLENRNKFAEDVVTLYHKYNLDGIDIDWEYPGEVGAAGNSYSPLDSNNFLAFLQLLRSMLPNNARISAATQVWPFTDANGVHMKDVSAFAKVLDWILVMNYDVWPSSANPGPNAPLSDACHNSTQPEANAFATIRTWTLGGFPANQILLGLPAYGYVSRSSATSLRTRRRSNAAGFSEPTPPAGDRTSGIASAAAVSGPSARNATVTVMSEGGSIASGQVQFEALILQGALVRNTPGASPHFVGAGGFERQWDACSSTPFLRSSAAQQVITYDDPESLAMKAAFVRQAGILGVNMWDAHGDTREWDLIDAVRRGLGVD